jgi:hypothetical protein
MHRVRVFWLLSLLTMNLMMQYNMI